MADGIDFPPRQVPFPDLDYGGMETGGPPHGSQVNGWPYDLIDDLRVTSWNPPTADFAARGGAVHYAGPRPGKGSYPPNIDRGILYRCQDERAQIETFWATSGGTRLQCVDATADDEQARLWVYADTNKVYFDLKIHKSDGAKLYIVDDVMKCSIKIDTNDFPTNSDPAELTVSLREMEICEKDDQGNAKKILVLCSQPYTT